MQQYSDESFINAVKTLKEGNLTSVIARAIGCDWNTAKVRLESLAASGKIKKVMLGERYAVYSM